LIGFHVVKDDQSLHHQVSRQRKLESRKAVVIVTGQLWQRSSNPVEKTGFLNSDNEFQKFSAGIGARVSIITISQTDRVLS
jgi:hypothetical protein